MPKQWSVPFLMHELNTVKFPEIDTSYWQVSDKSWLEERKESWLSVEPMFQGSAYKSKKALTIIKRYYLKGIMPDFEKLKDWQSDERHLDLFCFLWLHPSWDKAVLTELRDAYVSYEFTQKEDVELGVNVFFAYAAIRAGGKYKKQDDDTDVLQTHGFNELLFNVIMGDVDNSTIPEAGRADWSCAKRRPELDDIHEMSRWLGHDFVSQVAQDCLYQYANYLEYWYQCCETSEDYFSKNYNDRMLPHIKNGLYRIHNFDVEKEGDTCRSRFVLKMRKMLDEREFISAIKDMWQQAKAGTIETNNPWGKR